MLFIGEAYKANSGFIRAAAFPWSGDRVADAAVRQPAGVALVQAITPGQVELPGGGQRSPPSPAVPPGPLQGEAPRCCGVKHLPCKRVELVGKPSPSPRVAPSVPSEVPRHVPTTTVPLALQLPCVAVDIVHFPGLPLAVAADTGEAVAVPVAAGPGQRDGVPAGEGHNGGAQLRGCPRQGVPAPCAYRTLWSASQPASQLS